MRINPFSLSIVRCSLSVLVGRNRNQPDMINSASSSFPSREGRCTCESVSQIVLKCGETSNLSKHTRASTKYPRSIAHRFVLRDAPPSKRDVCDESGPLKKLFT